MHSHAKRLLLALVAMLLFTPAVLAQEAYVLSNGDNVCLVSPQGEVLYDGGELTDLFALSGGETPLFAALSAGGEKALYALIGADGQEITGFSYDYFLRYGDVLVFSRESKQGVMNEQGEEIIAPAYTCILPNGEGGYLALRTDSYDDTPDGVYYISPEGEERATGVKVAYALGASSEGLTVAASPDNGLFGYLNALGQWEILPQYTWCEPFEGGYASAYTSTGAGLINTEGNWIITPKYTYVCNLPGMPIACESEEGVALLDRETGRLLVSFQGAGQYANCAPNGYIGIIASPSLLLNKQGELLLTLPEGCIADVWNCCESAILVDSQGAWGDFRLRLYSPEGQPITEAYQLITYAGKKDGADYYLFGSFDTELIEYAEYNFSFQDEVPGTRRMGLMNAKGEIVIEPLYDSLYALGENLLAAQTETHTLLLDFAGNTLASFPLTK